MKKQSRKLAQGNQRRLAIAAIGILRLATTAIDGETITIGSNVYEVDTSDAEGITAGRIRLNLSGGTTVKGQGTLTIAEPVTANDTMTVGATVYTFVTGATAAAGQIGLGGSEANTKLAIVAAINGTDGFNTANASVTAAAFSGDACVLTAIKGGVQTIATTETFTHVSNVFDATTIGTTRAAVNPSVANLQTALVAAINARTATTGIAAYAATASVAVFDTKLDRAETIATTETLAGSNNAWAAATLVRIGAPDESADVAMQQRVANATEQALDQMIFVFPFTVTAVLVQVRTTAGVIKAYDGAITQAAVVGGTAILLAGAGSVDIDDTDVVTVLAR